MVLPEEVLRYSRQVRVEKNGNVANRLPRLHPAKYAKSPSKVVWNFNIGGDLRLKFLCQKLSRESGRLIVFHVIKPMGGSEWKHALLVENLPRTARREEWMQYTL